MKVDFDRSTNHHANYYDRSFNMLEFGEIECPPVKERMIPKPSCFEEMIELAERISRNHRFLRVDFYEVSGKVYFGETTFYPASGTGKFSPEDADLTIGSLLKL